MVTSGDSKGMASYFANLSSDIHKWLFNSRLALTWWGVRTSSHWSRVIFITSSTNWAVEAITLRYPGQPKAIPSSFFERLLDVILFLIFGLRLPQKFPFSPTFVVQRRRMHCFVTPSLGTVSFVSCSWLLLHLTGLNWGWLEIQKRGRIDRQKVGLGVLGAQVEIPNPHCFFSLSLFFKALLLAVL
jgi:hypothetical protein